MSTGQAHTDRDPEAVEHRGLATSIPAAHIAGLLEYADDADALARALVEALKTLGPTRHVDVAVHHAGTETPTRLWFSPHDADVEAYQSFYGLDPMTVAIIEGRRGPLTLRDVAPPGFEESALYKENYAAQGVIDEIVHVPKHANGFHAIAHISKSARFSRAEIERHAAAHPIVKAGLLRLTHLLAQSAAATHQGEEIEENRVDSALERFGKDVLTDREQEVIQLVLRGHNSESVSRQLGIKWNTVRGHRRRAYEKLGVTSQGELFFKFLEVLGIL